MIIEKYVTIYYPFMIDTWLGNRSLDKRHCNSVTLPADSLTEDKIPENAEFYSIFYVVKDRYSTKSKEGGPVKYLCRSKPLFEQTFMFLKNDLKHLSLMTQLTDMLARMPDIQLVEDKNTMYIRGVEEVYVSTHPEIEDFERREMPSAELKNVVIPRYCDKVIVYDELFKRVVIRDNMSKKDYQIELISPPIDQKTIFVGEEVEEANGFTIAKTRDGGFCFVDYGDILIPPDCIDEYGRIDSGYRL